MAKQENKTQVKEKGKSEEPKKIKPAKKKVKRNITTGIAFVNATFNNTIITIADENGNVIQVEVNNFPFDVTLVEKGTIVINSDVDRTLTLNGVFSVNVVGVSEAFKDCRIKKNRHKYSMHRWIKL